MSYRHDTKMFNEMSKYIVKCKCSHSVVITKQDRVLCTYCGNYVYKNKKIEFRYKLRERLSK